MRWKRLMPAPDGLCHFFTRGARFGMNTFVGVVIYYAFTDAWPPDAQRWHCVGSMMRANNEFGRFSEITWLMFFRLIKQPRATRTIQTGMSRLTTPVHWLKYLVS